MQFGHTLDRIPQEILLADPNNGPAYLIKIDINDEFYRIALNIDNNPKLGIVFPTLPGEKQLVAFPLVLPMGWSNSPTIFLTATETIADLANKRLQSTSTSVPHHLDDLAHSIPSPLPSCPMVSSPPSDLTQDPSLPTSQHQLAYADVFVYNFVGIAQEPLLQQHVTPIHPDLDNR